MVVEDLGSRNGLLVNNHHIEEPTLLHNGDILKIGSNTFGFYLKFKEEVQLEKYLHKLATKDPMTGLMSRSFFESTMDFEFKRSVRYQRPMTFVLMDIDHFKRVNDTYGHQVGDMVLEKVGKLICEELRGEDIGIRFGGEEFALILPETKEGGAYPVIERIRQRLEKTKFKIKDITFKVTASFGVAEVRKGMTTTQTLINKADKALYEAKAKGRNQSVFASKLAS